MPDMMDREKSITDAATTVFLRYGVKRTTMNDIAQEAGISRQTLYNAFGNKDDVLRALIRDFADNAIASVRDDCAKAETLSERLDALFRHMTIKPFDMLHSSPHADDILEGMNTAARDEIALKQRDYEHLIGDILAPAAGAIEAQGLTIARLSEHIYCAAKGIKLHASSQRHLRDMLEVLKLTIMKLAGHPSESEPS